MKSRKMICAGKFYPSNSGECLYELEKIFEKVPIKHIKGRILGGIVPHAGWVFSGHVAAEVFENIQRKMKNIDTFIIFGACHCGGATSPILFSGDKWQTPIGDVDIDTELNESMMNSVKGMKIDNFMHEMEHSIEVNLPLIRYKFPEAKVLPIIMPPTNSLISSSQIAEFLNAINGENIAVIGSSDLTHYGNDYGFTPVGEGKNGCEWAKNVNDTSIIRCIEQMDTKKVIENAKKQFSACGPGAIAATISVCQKMGANSATTLSHTHSSEIIKQKFNEESQNSVGYAGIIFTES